MDAAVGAGGELLAAFHDFDAGRRTMEHRRQAAELTQVQAQLARWRQPAVSAPERGEGAASLELEPTTQGRRPLVATVDQVEELLRHLREQWHLLVRTDNLFGPRFALDGVLLQLQLLDELLLSARAAARVEFVKLAAQYAESAAWLYEDGGDLVTAQTYNSRAMAWAQESGDDGMAAWTLFRRSQQAAYRNDAAEVIGLSQAARRNEAVLTPPMRAAIAQQEATCRFRSQCPKLAEENSLGKVALRVRATMPRLVAPAKQAKHVTGQLSGSFLSPWPCPETYRSSTTVAPASLPDAYY